MRDAVDAAFRAELAALALDAAPKGFWKERRETLEAFRGELLGALAQADRRAPAQLVRKLLHQAAESLRRTDELLRSVEERERATRMMKESAATLERLRVSVEAMRERTEDDR